MWNKAKEYALYIVVSDYLNILRSLEVRLSILRYGFEQVYEENVILRRRLWEASRENSRLNNVMFSFDFWMFIIRVFRCLFNQRHYYCFGTICICHCNLFVRCTFFIKWKILDYNKIWEEALLYWVRSLEIKCFGGVFFLVCTW